MEETQQMPSNLKQSKLHKYLFTVTTFSKLLALSMFIIFPIVAFYLGMQYQKGITVITPTLSYVKKDTSASTPNPTNISNWKIYTFHNLKFSIPSDWYTFNNTNKEIIFYKNVIKLGWDSPPGFVISLSTNETLANIKSKYLKDGYKNLLIKDEIVDNKKALRTKAVIPPGYDVKDHRIEEEAIQNNSDIYFFSASDYHISNEDIDKYFPDILSTFKFTN